MGDGVGDWDASSGTGSGNACGGCEAVEDPRCTGAGDPSSASCYATADESLATGSTDMVRLFLYSKLEIIMPVVFAIILSLILKFYCYHSYVHFSAIILKLCSK